VIRRLALFGALAAAGCAPHRAAAPPGPAKLGDPCVAGATACTVDGTGLLACAAGALAFQHPCRGPRGCVVGAAAAATCDQRVVAEGDGCDAADVGRFACSADRVRVATCDGRRISMAFYCRGPRGCRISEDGVYQCDESVGVEGEDCRTGGCSADGRWVMSCDPVVASEPGRLRAVLRKGQACASTERCVFVDMTGGMGGIARCEPARGPADHR
jgi:hypothetical protein